MFSAMISKVWKELEFIGFNAFSDCTALTCKKPIASNTLTIEINAFYGCINLKEVKMSANITSIGNMAFRECTSLTKIEIVNSFNAKKPAELSISISFIFFPI